jgi:hypothetical protein
METLDEDILAHVEAEIRDNIDRGMTPEEARRVAMRKFGNITQVKEDTRGVWIPVWLDQLSQDLHYGLRMLGRKPPNDNPGTSNLGTTERRWWQAFGGLRISPEGL